MDLLLMRMSSGSFFEKMVLTNGTSQRVGLSYTVLSTVVFPRFFFVSFCLIAIYIAEAIAFLFLEFVFFLWLMLDQIMFFCFSDPMNEESPYPLMGCELTVLRQKMSDVKYSIGITDVNVF